MDWLPSKDLLHTSSSTQVMHPRYQISIVSHGQVGMNNVSALLPLLSSVNQSVGQSVSQSIHQHNSHPYQYAPRDEFTRRNRIVLRQDRQPKNVTTSMPAPTGGWMHGPERGMSFPWVSIFHPTLRADAFRLGLGSDFQPPTLAACSLS